mmetsp:Transcript_60785/g.127375  ORF Transcript_60785/g.127375 Transcript_60785/m.127375 type:complete len:443 (-) Transcript_60785:576-1904(-)
MCYNPVTTKSLFLSNVCRCAGARRLTSLAFCVNSTLSSLFVCSYLVFGRSCSIVNLLEQSARPGTILASFDAAGALPECGWSRSDAGALKATTVQNIGLFESVEVDLKNNPDEKASICPFESKQEPFPLVEDANIISDDRFDDHDKNPDEVFISSQVNLVSEGLLLQQCVDDVMSSAWPHDVARLLRPTHTQGDITGSGICSDNLLQSEALRDSQVALLCRVRPLAATFLFCAALTSFIQGCFLLAGLVGSQPGRSAGVCIAGAWLNLIFGALALVYAGALLLLFWILIWSPKGKDTGDGESGWMSDATTLRFAQIALVMAPAVFVGPFDGPGWTSCVLWAFTAAILRIVDTSQSANCVPCVAIFLSMVAVISSVDASCRFGLHESNEAIPAALLVLYALHHPLPLLLSLLPLAVLFSNILDDEAKLEVPNIHATAKFICIK